MLLIIFINGAVSHRIEDAVMGALCGDVSLNLVPECDKKLTGPSFGWSA